MTHHDRARPALEPMAAAAGCKGIIPLKHDGSKARKNAQPESALQKSVAAYLNFALRGLPATWFHVPNGGTRKGKTINGKWVSTEGARLRAEGVIAGVADCIIIHAGQPLAIELKAPGRQGLSENQKAWREQFVAAGGAYTVARTLDDVHEFLTRNGVPVPMSLRTTAGRAPAE